MDKEQANRFCRRWKTSPRLNVSRHLLPNSITYPLQRHLPSNGGIASAPSTDTLTDSKFYDSSEDSIDGPTKEMLSLNIAFSTTNDVEPMDIDITYIEPMDVDVTYIESNHNINTEIGSGKHGALRGKDLYRKYRTGETSPVVITDLISPVHRKINNRLVCGSLNESPKLRPRMKADKGLEVVGRQLATSSALEHYGKQSTPCGKNLYMQYRTGETSPVVITDLMSPVHRKINKRLVYGSLNESPKLRPRMKADKGLAVVGRQLATSSTLEHYGKQSTLCGEFMYKYSIDISSAITTLSPVQIGTQNNLLYDKRLAGSNEIPKDHSIRNADKEVELVGSQLTKQENIEWSEYWDNLNQFIAFATPDDLDRLECYFMKRTSARKPNFDDMPDVVNLKLPPAPIYVASAATQSSATNACAAQTPVKFCAGARSTEKADRCSLDANLNRSKKLFNALQPSDVSEINYHNDLEDSDSDELFYSFSGSEDELYVTAPQSPVSSPELSETPIQTVHIFGCFYKLFMRTDKPSKEDINVFYLNIDEQNNADVKNWLEALLKRCSNDELKYASDFVQKEPSAATVLLFQQPQQPKMQATKPLLAATKTCCKLCCKRYLRIQKLAAAEVKVWLDALLQRCSNDGLEDAPSTEIVREKTSAAAVLLCQQPIMQATKPLLASTGNLKQTCVSGKRLPNTLELTSAATEASTKEIKEDDKVFNLNIDDQINADVKDWLDALLQRFFNDETSSEFVQKETSAAAVLLCQQPQQPMMKATKPLLQLTENLKETCVSGKRLLRSPKLTAATEAASTENLKEKCVSGKRLLRSPKLTAAGTSTKNLKETCVSGKRLLRSPKLTAATEAAEAATKSLNRTCISGKRLLRSPKLTVAAEAATKNLKRTC